MAENQSEEEPSIEEILASIRQIISDDDEEGDKTSTETVDEDIVEDPVRHESNDVLELTEEDLEQPEEPEESYAEPEPMEVDMVDRTEEIAEEPVREPEPAPRPVPSDILSSGTQAAALDSISKLASKMPINSSRSYDGVTLEDIVREMLHPMLREWMDDNLPPMVERIVQKELEKLARRAMDD